MDAQQPRQSHAIFPGVGADPKFAPFAQFDGIAGEVYFERTRAMFLEPFAQMFDRFRIRN